MGCRRRGAGVGAAPTFLLRDLAGCAIDGCGVLGTRRVRLMPSYHPAAALYQRSNRELIAADFARIPELLALGPPEQPAAAAAEPTAEDLAAARAELAAEAAQAAPEPAVAEDPDAEQLGLF